MVNVHDVAMSRDDDDARCVAGHYITDVLSMEKRQWYSYDDSDVTRISENDVREKRTRSGYIFFYVSK